MNSKRCSSKQFDSFHFTLFEFRHQVENFTLQFHSIEFFDGKKVKIYVGIQQLNVNNLKRIQ